MHRTQNTFMTIPVNESRFVSHSGQKTSVQGIEGSQRKFHCFAQIGFFCHSRNGFLVSAR